MDQAPRNDEGVVSALARLRRDLHRLAELDPEGAAVVVGLVVGLVEDLRPALLTR